MKKCVISQIIDVSADSALNQSKVVSLEYTK